ncbi:SgcJ/EcaC family oxidoreductase [Nitratireductor aquibiodomus]|uniref:YybH family protein n=1 Tax=Nitratireductor TaxID=245876 RepID=UPI0019D326EB|nr:SgcJ/EcaC family oxidoreductase [Nitratireductor sp. GZWM139]MBN7760256.1 SgcJ/EcaC family oxidoreductase [Nitratireductor aquibiodomus]MDJ1463893.1 SgcJ/EcaC family oxidoreductase [Nitratireductor sp. GZWM139]
MSDLRGNPDATAIETTLRTLLAAFQERDASILREVYVEDADWTNAFGTALSGRDRIIDYLTGLFADPNFSAGKMLGQPDINIRSIGSDVVVAKTQIKVEGQQTVDGEALPTRHNHSLKVLHRQASGRWLIVSEIYMDARTEATYLD